MTSQTNMTARNLRQFGKRQLPSLLSEYWLVADESNAKHFQDFKHINKVPPISENGGDWKGTNWALPGTFMDAPLSRSTAKILSRSGSIADQRVEQCKRILKLVSDCKEDENKLHSSMHPDVARVLQGKRLLVWKQLLIEPQ